MHTYNDNLYAATGNFDGCQLWYTADGQTWTVAVGAGATTPAGFGDTNNDTIPALTDFGTYLYVGTYNGGGSGAQIWRSSDLTYWEPVVGDSATVAGGFGDSNNDAIGRFATYNGYLYAGTQNQTTGCEVWRTTDGTTWTQVNTDGFGAANNQSLNDMVVMGQYLYAGTDNADGCQLWRTTDGTTWTEAGTTAFGDTNNQSITCLGIQAGTLLAGTNNGTTGGEVWLITDDSVTYFAEGFTSSDFSEYICIQNPNTSSVSVTLTFMQPAGTTVTTTRTMGPTTRETVNVSDYVSGEVSTKVEATGGETIIAERAMYWNKGGIDWVAGHCSPGVNTPTRSVYFAEGYTSDDFYEYICIQNPNSISATVSVTFMDPNGNTVATAVTIAPTSRETVNVGNHISGEVSTLVTCENTNINAERVMYRNGGGIDWIAGHCSTGALSAAGTWYFAEGYTGSDFDEFICIQNPHAATAEVTVTYMQPDGTTTTSDMTVGPTTRETINVEQTVSGEVSVQLQSTNGVGIVGERVIYWDKNDITWIGAHCCPGATANSTTKYFAEGYTASDFDEYICIQNPNSTSAEVAVTFMAPNGTTVATTRTIGPATRDTVNVSQYVSGEVSTQLTTTNGVGFVAERSMYWDRGGIDWVGGHCSNGK